MCGGVIVTHSQQVLMLGLWYVISEMQLYLEPWVQSGSENLKGLDWNVFIFIKTDVITL